MKLLRLRLAALVIWLFLLYNIERLGQTVNIASFVYVLTALAAAAILRWPAGRRLPSYWMFPVLLLIFFTLKPLLGYQIGGANFSNTVVEVCVIGVTVLLAAKASRDTEAIAEELARLAVGPLHTGASLFETSQAQIYREIRRARRYHHPLTLLVVVPDEVETGPQRDRYIQEIGRTVVKRYVAARTAKFLVDALKDSDIIAQRGDRFVMLLPETDRENAARVVERLQAEAKTKHNLSFLVGMASFPDEAVTLESLLVLADAAAAPDTAGGKPVPVANVKGVWFTEPAGTNGHGPETTAAAD